MFTTVSTKTHHWTLKKYEPTEQLIFCSLKINLNVSSHLRLGLSSSFVPSGFQQNFVCVGCLPCPSHLSLIILKMTNAHNAAPHSVSLSSRYFLPFYVQIWAELTSWITVFLEELTGRSTNLPTFTEPEVLLPCSQPARRPYGTLCIVYAK
jgi:hypothetical protein